MKHPGSFAVLFMVLAAIAPAALAQKDVTLTAADGVKITGSYYPAAKASAPIILLFHQAGSNRWEYAPIAPKLAAAGFSCLAIDARHGGEMWGHPNETVARLGKEAGYLEALPDLEAALAWARRENPSRKIIVWGSSYSSCLVFVLAAKHPGEIAGLLSFSPAEYFKGNPNLVHDAAAKVKIPVFITSAKDQEEEEAAKSIFDATASKKESVLYKPVAGGVHGSSTLRADRNPEGADQNWAAVLAFLKEFQQ